MRYYTIKRILRRQLPLGPETFIAGDTDAMHGAMPQLDLPIPAPDDYPSSLREFLGRTVWTATLGEVERALGDGSLPPTFVKPAERRKGFTGAVCYSERDVASLGPVSRRQRVWCSEVVRWLAEYLEYVVGERIAAVERYAGDGTARLDPDVVRAAVAAHRGAPAGYGIDFGVLADGRTALVEANDGYALGAYGIAADDYTELTLRRWSSTTVPKA